jgi:hypothetical protein
VLLLLLLLGTARPLPFSPGFVCSLSLSVGQLVGGDDAACWAGAALACFFFFFFGSGPGVLTRIGDGPGS